jgi:hypothetical protein
MPTHRLARILVPAVCMVGAGAVAIGSVAATPEAGPAAAKRITRSGVDGVRLGMTHRQLRQRGLVGTIRRGCELGGPNTRSAKLLAPLRGQVNYTLRNPRKVTDITIRGGAKARGVGIGAKIPAIRAAFPKAKVDHSTDQTFALTLVRIPRNGGGRITFGVSTRTKRTTLIGVPVIAFCE